MISSSKLQHLFLACALALGCISNHASAAQFTVSNTHDSGPGSLRAAILGANAHGGRIVFKPHVSGKITLLSALPGLAANITILGPGKQSLAVSGANAFPVFSMNSGTTNTIFGLTIADGWTLGTFFPPHYTFASGISNAGSLQLVDCVVSNCASVMSLGAGIYNAGNLDLNRCLVTDCFEPNGDTFNLGGGIYNGGTLNIANSTIANCTGGGNTTGGGGIYNAGTLFMSGSTIRDCDNTIEGDGGGILNEAQAVLNNCVISNCFGFWAGGIKTYGSLWMTNCSVLNNLANEGAGIMSFGPTILSGCTVAGNIGYLVGGALDNFADMSLYNCTISQNQILSFAALGSGITDGFINGITGPTTLLLRHCTVVSNTAPVEIYTINSIVSEASIIASCAGTLNSFAGHNLLLSTDGCVFTGLTVGDLDNVNPLLGPLRNNGGPTLTHALLAGSPAINAGGPADPTTTDQRGVRRPQGLASAYEFTTRRAEIVRLNKQSRSKVWLQWNASPQSTCTLQASTDCIHWVSLTNAVCGPNGLAEFVDADAGKYPARFYRLMTPARP
jgi:hypothetical protein